MDTGVDVVITVFLPIFGEKIGVLIKNEHIFSLSKKRQYF
jgi:hypothetical protein